MTDTLQIGRVNQLTIIKTAAIGAFLDGGNPDAGGWGEILLPARYMPEACREGDVVSVFVYFDSEDRPIATTELPKAQVGEFAYLRVVDVNRAGAFLDWGLPKDVMVPYAEQSKPMREGAFYVVYIYQDDESERITASSKINRHLNNTHPTYQLGESVNALVMAETDLGYKVIINNQHTGLIYSNECFSPLKIGQTLSVLVQKVRDDGKIDVRLPQPDKKNLSELEQQVMHRLEANNGIMYLGDKTPPEDIYRALGVSKKNFKRAVSRLYKERLIIVHPDKVTLVE